jgi:Ca2+-binding EF-hand superfamily protein
MYDPTLNGLDYREFMDAFKGSLAASSEGGIGDQMGLADAVRVEKRAQRTLHQYDRSHGPDFNGPNAAKADQMLKRKLGLQGTDIMKAFRRMDRDDSKSLDHDEFRSVMCLFNIEMSDVEFSKLMDKYDPNNDGINYHEFAAAFNPNKQGNFNEKGSISFMLQQKQDLDVKASSKAIGSQPWSAQMSNMNEIMSGSWQKKKKRLPAAGNSNQTAERIKSAEEKNRGRRNSLDQGKMKKPLSPADQARLFKNKLGKDFANITKLESPSFSFNNNSARGSTALSRSMPGGLRQSWQPKPQSLVPRRRMGKDQIALVNLDDEQRRALKSFEGQLSKKFLQTAKFYKFVQPLSQGEFSSMVGQLMGTAAGGSSAPLGGGLTRGQAESLLFAKYSNSDGCVHYQTLAGHLKRGSGGDESKEGARNVWGGVLGNSTTGGRAAFTNPLDAKTDSLMRSGAVWDLFGEGFPLADVCANWKSIRQMMKKSDRWNNGCISKKEVRNILVMDFGIAVTAAHLERVGEQFEGNTAGTVRYDPFLKGCLKARSGASQVALMA